MVMSKKRYFAHFIPIFILYSDFTKFSITDLLLVFVVSFVRKISRTDLFSWYRIIITMLSHSNVCNRKIQLFKVFLITYSTVMAAPTP